MSKTIISVSGLRGIVGDSIDPILAQRFVLAFASTLSPGRVVVGRDGRATGDLFSLAVSSGLMAAGFDVLDADVCATPTLGVLVREHQCSGGIQISASHNPPEYNGIKLFGPSGRVISAGEGREVIRRFEANELQFASHSDIGSCTRLEDTVSAHLRLILATIDREKILAKNFRVVLDSNHGAGSILAKELLDVLGCQAEIVGSTPDGLFAHVPEPTEENLKSVAEQAKTFAADAVFCQDPDADRLAIIDENGAYVGEEYTLAITLKHALQRAQSKGFGDFDKTVVINCATSRMSIDIAESLGCRCLISPVGEANVTSLMIEKNAVYGGEGNGGPIDPRVGFVRDSFVAMAQVLDAMAETDLSVSKLAGEIKPYHIIKTKVDLEPNLIESAFDRIEQTFPDAKVNRMDGLRLDFDNRWLLVRGSNTEPIVRVIAEAANQNQAQELVDQARSIIGQLG